MCRPLVDFVAKAPLRPQTVWQEPPMPLAIPGSTKVALADGSVVTVRSLGEPAAERLLLLACGLAHPRPDIPKFERDTEGVKVILAPQSEWIDPPDQWW